MHAKIFEVLGVEFFGSVAYYYRHLELKNVNRFRIISVLTFGKRFSGFGGVLWGLYKLVFIKCFFLLFLITSTT